MQPNQYAEGCRSVSLDPGILLSHRSCTLPLPPGSGRKEIGMANQAVSQPANQAVSQPAFDLAFPVVPGLLTIAPGATAQHWLEYVTDACQRGVLFLDLLRRRGNEEKEITAQPMATVLRFDHELLMSGQ